MAVLEEVSGPALRELVARCCAGDDAAQAQLVLVFTPLIQRVAARRLAHFLAATPERMEVEDVSAEVWAYLLRDGCHALRSLHQPERLAGWLCAVTANRAVDYLRRIGAQRRAEEFFCEAQAPYPVPSADAPLHEEERRETAERLLAVLSDEDRLVLNLFFRDGCKYSEIAELLGLNINTVASRIRRAKLALRTRYKEQADA